jgi:putative transposase
MKQVQCIKIRKGQKIFIEDKGNFVALRRLTGQKVQFEKYENGELLNLSDHDIAILYLTEKLTFDFSQNKTGIDNADHSDSAAAIPESEAHIACERYQLVQNYLETSLAHSERFVTKFLADQTVQSSTNLPSPRHFLRWLNDVKSSPAMGAQVLIPKHYRKGTSGPRLDPRVEKIIQEKIDEVFMTDKQFVLADVNSAVSESLIELRHSGIELSMPSPSTVKRRIKSQDGYETKLKRNGKKAADKAFKPAGAYPQPTRPNEVWQIDHTWADTFVYDSIKEKSALARPWITTIIDVFTRCVMSIYVTFDPPSYISVMAALWRAIMPKDLILQSYGLQDLDWPCFGRPETIVMDNGKEFHSESLKRALQMLGIRSNYAESGKPQRKPNVERFQGTLNRSVCHRMDGTTFSNITQRGEIDAQKNARHDIQFLRTRLIEWTVNIYHKRTHSSLGESPSSRMYREMQRSPISLPPAGRDLRIMLSPLVKDVTIRKDGIKYDNLTYWAPDLTIWLTQLNTECIKVDIREDPDDVGFIWVQHPKKREFIKAMCREAGLAGMSRYVHRLKAAERRRNLNNDLKNQELIKANEQFRAHLNKDRKPRKIKPGGRKEARLSTANYEGALKAVENGALEGTKPPWSTNKTLGVKVTVDNWPIEHKPEDGKDNTSTKGMVASEANASPQTKRSAKKDRPSGGKVKPNSDQQEIARLTEEEWPTEQFQRRK